SVSTGLGRPVSPAHIEGQVTSWSPSKGAGSGSFTARAPAWKSTSIIKDSLLPFPRIELTSWSSRLFSGICFVNVCAAAPHKHSQNISYLFCERTTSFAPGSVRHQVGLGEGGLRCWQTL